MPGHVRGMNNQHRRTIFAPSDDALIRQQPVTRMGLKRLATIHRQQLPVLRLRRLFRSWSLPL